VKENEELTVQVPVIVKGTPVGVKDGGTLQFIMHKVRVSCLPKFIPEHIEIEVTNLKMNETIHVSDIKLENARIIDNEASTIVAVVPPTIVKEETPAAAVEGAAVAAPAEPEVIAKGKKPAEGEEAAKPTPAAPAPAKK
jgi:large subunit ribosomal protein L25